MTSLGVFAAVFDPEGRVLCVRHAYGAKEWGMPGGQLEAGEDPVTAVKREIAEEAGVHAGITEFIGLYSAPYRDDLVLLFAGQVEKQLDWSPNEEISECGFFNLADLPRPMAANPQLRFDHLRSGLRGVLCTFAAPGIPSKELSLMPSR